MSTLPLRPLFRPRPLLYPLSNVAFTTTRPRRSASPGPILPTLRPALLAAMKAKDTQRLTVLRSLLASITNASKTSSPIANDAALYTLLNKRISECNTAAKEFGEAGRQDLVEKEQGEVVVLKEIAERCGALSEEEVRGVVEGVVEGMKGEKGGVQVGKATGKVLGELKGKPVDREMVMRVVKEVAEA
ncbi:GatB/YqeY domain-containing protein [Lophium mytilinum]|uniref:Altered inheritance of mitochondria protein 41 n=1 Tax=Lophium mytilinum TaxID=390894 RepID=A0A6A6QCY6_9PEZI|nr:GatB/YqeY domain-containing protein [Lophium mytilinum]